MKFGSIALALACALTLSAETAQERGKRVVDDCVQALGGDTYLHMENRVEAGRAYSFYRERLSGLSIATIYTRYDSDVTDTAHELAQHERENFDKKQDYGVLFADEEAWDITYRGARPLPKDTFARYKDTTLHDIFYILRVRLHEPGMIFECRRRRRAWRTVRSRSSISQTPTIARSQSTSIRSRKLPVRQVFYRRDPVTKDKNEEVTLFTKYRECRWDPMAVRHRAGPQRRENLRDFF